MVFGILFGPAQAYECQFHDIAGLFDGIHLLPDDFCGAGVGCQHDLLGRAQVPSTYKRALAARQPATRRAKVPAIFAPGGHGLTRGDAAFCQVEEKKIPEIEPDSGPPAAYIQAPGAGFSAQGRHEGVQNSDRPGNGKALAAQPVRPAAEPVQVVAEAVICLLPRFRA